MKRLASCVLAVCLLHFCSLAALNPSDAQAGEIGYIEDFALTADREAALKQLIPGSRDYYYYHCLHFQNTEQFEKVGDMVKDWVRRHGYTSRVRLILNRQSLLTYAKTPDETLAYLKSQLNLHFNHQREPLSNKPNLPTVLDQKLISRERLSQIADRSHSNLGGYEDPALDWLTGRKLTPDRQRHLLQRLQRPDYPNLVKLVLDDLNYRYSGGFGSHNIHKQMLLPQLQDLLKQKPELRNQTAFVNVYITKLWPNHDTAWNESTATTIAYLDRVWEFVSTLAPAHNSLKAHVLYHRLAADRSLGVFDKDRFMTYLSLPRHVSYIEPEFMKVEANRRYAANLSANYTGVTQLPAVGNDEPLVRAYLHHFFKKEASYKAYTTYINDVYLKHNFAETKIVNGLGDGETWYSLLPPEKYQSLKQRIDIDFAATNKTHFSSDEAVSLEVDVKNVKSLIVKVYEINAENFYRENLRQIDTDLNLDGLVANNENTHTYAEPPLRRVRRRFDFATLNRPGVYIVDFIGNGKSSRALIRKGGLRFLSRTTPAGQLVTVLNDSNQTVKGAALWLGGREFTASEDGRIMVPFSASATRTPVVLTHGELASLDYFQHEAENYSLSAGILVDRETLLEQKETRVVIRPMVKLNGEPVAISTLEQPRLVIQSTDLDGVQSMFETTDIKLMADGETTYEFQTPPRARTLTFTLSGKVQNLSRNTKVDLSASQTVSINGIETTDKTEDLHFSRFNSKTGPVYAVDLLGKSGEPKGDRAVTLTIKHRDFKQTVTTTLETSPSGRIWLGALTDIVSVTAASPQGVSSVLRPTTDRAVRRGSMHAAAGDVLQTPYMGAAEKPQRDEVSLLEVRKNVFVADRFDSMKIANGMLQLTGLPPGDYDLLFKATGQQIRIRITQGKEVAGFIAGEYRQLEVRDASPLQIASVKAGKEQLKIQLTNGGEFARVHVIATRYQPAFDAFEALSRVRDAESYHFVSSKAVSAYVIGRDIGDEYRYIIDRKYARKFPGNMLERPSLLLNPWAIRNTETAQQAPQSGDAFDTAGDAQERFGGRPGGSPAGTGAKADFSNLNFLNSTSQLVLNLTAGEKGELSVPLEQLGGRQHIHVVAVDPVSTVYRSITLEDADLAPRDLRLANNLDPAKHFTQQKQITTFAKGKTLELSDLVSSRFENYDSLTRVYGLLSTLTTNATFTEFSFVLSWPGMKDEQKREKYSKYASHELNFFLYQKDRKFFNKVVKPYLANKKDKTFMDEWLLELPLGDYLAPWRYQQLNVIERILLGRRLKGEYNSMSRHVGDMFAMLPADIEKFNRQFDTAVQGSALEVSTATGVAGKIRNELKKIEQLSRRRKDFAIAEDNRDFAQNGASALSNFARPVVSPEPSAAPVEAKPSSKPADAELRLREEDAKGDGNSDRNGKKSATDKYRYSKKAEKQANGSVEFFNGRGLVAGKLVRQLYRKLDKTQEWVENNYYKLPVEQQNAQLVSVNGFWRDYSLADLQGPFVSTNVADASRNFTEMMFALSVLDLPFTAAEHKVEFAGPRMRLTASGAMIVFHEEIREATSIAKNTPVLVSQNFFRHGDRYRYENSQRIDKFITGEFLIHTVYGCQVVVTNPSSSRQKLDLLLQVPAGAIPVLNGKNTRSVHMDLQPYRTQTLDYHFYFPAAGEFTHYPVHVSQDAELLAHAKPTKLKVVAEASEIDRGSWDYISQHGAAAEVVNFLNTHNLLRVNLDKIAFRMHDAGYFQQITALLNKRHVYSNTLWSYSIKHNKPSLIREYLQHANGFAAQCGAYLDSPLLTIDPVQRKTYQHRDYRPLVNARAHQLGRRRQILNDRLHQQYHQLMDILSFRPQLDDHDRMSVTYYLLLQDRIESAQQFFSKVNRNKLPVKLQHDYFTAYFDFFSEQPTVARDIAARYADYPVDRWRDAFVNITTQLDELEGGAAKVVDKENRDQQQTQLAATEPGLDFKVESKKVKISYQNLKQVKVNYYLMDIELLFSRNPFVQQFSGRFSHIRPNLTAVVDLPADKPAYEFELPEELHNSNVLVEINGGGQTRSQAYYSHSLSLQVTGNYGQLRVTHQETGRALPKTYVKVYARMKDGKVKFYKDGYTDLRGRFDYTSLSTNELEFVQKFSLLVLSQKHGAIVREASPPKQ